MKVSEERQRNHREIMDKYPSDEPCACDPAHDCWCAFHSEFHTDMSKRSRELLGLLAAQASMLNEAIKDYLAYAHTVNHKKVSGEIGGLEALFELYLKERERDHEAARQLLRQERELNN